jgi:hypothetical protein
MPGGGSMLAERDRSAGGVRLVAGRAAMGGGMTTGGCPPTNEDGSEARGVTHLPRGGEEIRVVYRRRKEQQNFAFRQE